MPEMRLWYDVLMDLWHQDHLRKRNVERRRFFLNWACRIVDGFHHAPKDARWTRQAWEFLTDLKRTKDAR